MEDAERFAIELEKVLVLLQQARGNVGSLRTGDRSEEQRRLAILATELEKVLALAEYIRAAAEGQ